MSIPLPLTVYGPVTPLSPSVSVSGVLAGAVVTIFGNGDAIGEATATKNGQLNVLLKKQPAVGGNISATQKNADGISEPSLQVIPVVDVPDPLPTPAIASALNTCMTDIYGDNLVPGATVVTLINGVPFGSAPAADTLAWLGIDPAKGINAGAIASIHQEANIGGVLRVSPTVESPPIPQYHLVTHGLPAPVLGPLQSCVTSIDFIQVVEGAVLTVQNEGQSETWINPASSYPGEDGLPLRKGKATITQAMARCQLTSVPIEMPVAQASDPGAPVSNEAICPDVRQMTLSGLVPGGVLNVFRQVWPGPTVTGSTESPVGDYGIAYATQEFALPPGLALTDPAGTVHLAVTQTLCGLAGDRAAVSVLATPHTGDPIRIGDELYACSRGIPVTNAVPGAIVQAFDADTNLPISDPVGPTAAACILGCGVSR